MQAIQVRMSLLFHTELRVKMILIQGPYFDKVCKDIFIGPTVIFTPPDLDAVAGQVDLLVEPVIPLAACVTRSDTSSSVP